MLVGYVSPLGLFCVRYFVTRWICRPAGAGYVSVKMYPSSWVVLLDII
ncbi:hypothetical protein Pf1_01305 [Flavobacterium columnare]|nr:hypothetical protein Pf1_01305 [Flavobacterium columnare]